MSSNETTLARDGSGAMFDAIAQRYDLLNRVLSFGIDGHWRRKTVRSLNLPKNAQVLDLATGTGDVAFEIARQHQDAQITGVDPSARMLEVAADKTTHQALTGRIEYALGDAQALPFANDRFDATTIAFGIRNVPDRAQGLREMARVTKPGGRIAILELAEPRRGFLGVFARFYIHHMVPRIGAWLSGAHEYRYLQQSIAAFPDANDFASMMLAANIEVLEVRPLTFGVCTLYVGTPRANPTT